MSLSYSQLQSINQFANFRILSMFVYLQQKAHLIEIVFKSARLKLDLR